MRVVVVSARLAAAVLVLALLAAALWSGIKVDRHLTFEGAPLVQGAWGAEEGQFGQGLGRDGLTYGPRSFAVDREGRVYVLDWANQRLQRFDAAGRLTGFLPLTGAGGMSLQGAEDVVADGEGGLWLADNLRGRLAYFQPGGQVHELRSFGEVEGALLERTAQLAPLQRGVVWSQAVVTPEEAVYQVRTVGGYGEPARDVYRASLSKTGDGGPLPIALACGDSEVYLLLPLPGEQGAGLVQRHGLDGKLVKAWKVPAMPEAGLRQTPELLGVDAKGRTYLGTWAKGTLHLRVFNPAGMLLAHQALPAGREARTYIQARVDSGGNLYVADLSAKGYSIARYRQVSRWSLHPSWVRP